VLQAFALPSAPIEARVGIIAFTSHLNRYTLFPRHEL
jgi:hypothetical protein